MRELSLSWQPFQAMLHAKFKIQDLYKSGRIASGYREVYPLQVRDGEAL